MTYFFSTLFLVLFTFCQGISLHGTSDSCWIRINLAGYKPSQPKVAVLVGKRPITVDSFFLFDNQGRQVFAAKKSHDFGSYGPFIVSYRLDFSAWKEEGTYTVRIGKTSSPAIRIANGMYNGTADFCLRYMRQQRCGFNPSIQDSCHTHDGYTLYGPMPDSTHMDVTGGWHDASDYLQYVTTSANAVYHLLAAWRDFPSVFHDKHNANGLAGSNNIPDVLDESMWGLDWLLKMHPRRDWMFHQIADDRDHLSMRIPGMDNQYGKGYERPVYFCTGKPQGSVKFKNRSTGIANIAGKMSSAFSLGSVLMRNINAPYSDTLSAKATSAFELGMANPGVCQTAPNRAPYFYEEDNWADDMGLAAVLLHRLKSVSQYNVDKKTDLLSYSSQLSDIELITPWISTDTARHYQWYPFVNAGHYELAAESPSHREKCMTYYRQGIEQVLARAQQNAFYRGIPFIWCSNNLTVSFAIQCKWYRKLTGDKRYMALEQACVDWLLGCNPWGTSFVFGFPSDADTPVDPHSALTHLAHLPLDGALVDGPVKGSIFNRLIGIRLYEDDEYAAFQSDVAVYHDDYGDYSTNEPTMDGVASLVYLMAALEEE